ncbi:MAG TPA: saccharopine dehydrogenase C-terminal domain-containing protein [Anaerolineales bacterium]|nr:saccharopine dehydrogenase C-terminal domain-containing protein [Anaerolineales bacterium]
MTYRYAILGSGRQGTAAAYDMGRFGDAEVVWMLDSDIAQAERAVARVNVLLGKPLARPAAADASDPHSIAGWLRQEKVTAFLSAVPYFFNLGLTHAAIEAGAGMTDLGGNSDVVFGQLDLTSEAEAAGITVVPDCGQVPGMGTSLILYALEALDEPRDVFMWDCGLPQNPTPPWNYRLTFSIEGLTNEYFGDCVFIRDGKTVGVPALEELEVVEFPAPVGRLEAFTTAGGLTTAARTFAGRLRTLQNKTLRYPGHYTQLKVMQQLGLLELKPIEVDGHPVIPRHVLHTLWDRQIRADAETRDLILIRILARGLHQGRPMDVWVDLMHLYDETTGFTAMEQGTGWHAAILTEAIARGTTPRGVIPVERAMSGATFVEEAARRGFAVRRDVRPSADPATGREKARP